MSGLVSSLLLPSILPSFSNCFHFSLDSSQKPIETIFLVSSLYKPIYLHAYIGSIIAWNVLVDRFNLKFCIKSIDITRTTSSQIWYHQREVYEGLNRSKIWIRGQRIALVNSLIQTLHFIDISQAVLITKPFLKKFSEFRCSSLAIYCLQNFFNNNRLTWNDYSSFFSIKTRIKHARFKTKTEWPIWEGKNE